MRVFECKRVWALSPLTYQRAAMMLSEAVGRLWRIDVVVGIAKGGRIPAMDLASRLARPYYEVVAKYNRSDAIYSETESRVSFSLGESAGIPEKAHVLLVDDICGSGATMSVVIKRLHQTRHCASVRTLVLCRNSGGEFIPDLYVWTVSDWVIFPWERVPEGVEVEQLPTPHSCISGSLEDTL